MVFCEAKIDDESYQSMIYIVAVVGKPKFFSFIASVLSFATTYWTNYIWLDSRLFNTDNVANAKWMLWDILLFF